MCIAFFHDILHKGKKKKKIIGQMASFEFFFRVAFCFAKIRLFRVTLSLHSFAPLRNWLRQPLQSLPRFVNQILEIKPIKITSFLIAMENHNLPDNILIEENNESAQTGKQQNVQQKK